VGVQGPGGETFRGLQCKPWKGNIMEFEFNEREAAFRNEVEEFIKTELPPGWPEISTHWPGGYGSMETSSDSQFMEVMRQFRKKLVEKGWYTMAWPKEYGGKQYSYMEQAIYDERLSYYRTPGGMANAVGIAGPSLLNFGTEENKKQWVPRIASGEIEMWLGYSEPAAGSDLAGIQTTAVEDGDDYVVNGQKTWSTLAHLSEYAWMIVRTDPEAPRHKGISILIIDNKTPGITIRPLVNIVGVHSFNEVFFDNVRVPKKNLIGEENMGFYYLMTALAFERVMVAGIGGYKRILEELTEYVKQTKREGRPLAENISVRKQLALVSIKLEIAYMFFWRTAEKLDKGLDPTVEASALKLGCTELSRLLADVSMEILGPYSQLMMDSKYVPFRGMAPRGYLDCISATVGAGSSEIMRNIIATRGLGLPRSGLKT
jgi:alkylation response protein AidB-like acyl-CoA dehydrogenase